MRAAVRRAAAGACARAAAAGAARAAVLAAVRVVVAAVDVRKSAVTSLAYRHCFCLLLWFKCF